MLLAYAKADGRLAEWEDVTYELAEKPDGKFDGSAWMQVAKPPLREKNALMNLPYLIDHDSGAVVTQSTAVFQYIGRCVDMMGGSAAELAACEQILAEAFDLRNVLMEIVYPFKGTNPDNYHAKMVCCGMASLPGLEEGGTLKIHAWPCGSAAGGLRLRG